MLQSINHLHGPSLDSLQYVHVSLVLGSSALDTVFQGKVHLPQPAGNTPPDAAQDTISLLCCKGTLLAHVQLGVHQDPQVLFCEAAFKLSGSQHILEHEVVPSQVKDFALLVELHEVSISLLLQPVEVPLDGSTTLWHTSCSSQFGVICKLAEGTLCPIIQIINEDVEQDWSHYWPTTRLCATVIAIRWAWLFSQLSIHLTVFSKAPETGANQKDKETSTLAEAAILEIREESACLEAMKGPNEEQEDPRA
ncbi:hypothetical protein QYF61_025320 [Mycteria americana]|uniref:Uncharacterized protein n=1 Tax=Mycteria americana TaxID=33587 RepID=A0AAN7PMB6_MYCAM|nr:hypothetical protein QYF61_025320 [Mycteria americana]